MATGDPSLETATARTAYEPLDSCAVRAVPAADHCWPELVAGKVAIVCHVPACWTSRFTRATAVEAAPAAVKASWDPAVVACAVAPKASADVAAPAMKPPPDCEVLAGTRIVETGAEGAPSAAPENTRTR